MNAENCEKSLFADKAIKDLQVKIYIGSKKVIGLTSPSGGSKACGKLLFQTVQVLIEIIK